jgi:prepilin-type N-terminal cleavage/methylation domain-containing protein
MKSARQPAAVRRGFTLIELLVVIGIIVLLIAILLPVVASVRKQAYNTSTQNQMSRIMAACLAYYHDHGAYPGPISNLYVAGGPKQGADPNPQRITGQSGTITSSENLVLGLLGFLKPPTTATGVITFIGPPLPTPPGVPPTDVANLNFLHPASYHYIDYVPDELTGTGFSKNLEYATGRTPSDSNVPEFTDRFPDHMPILYTRANVGVVVTTPATIAASITNTNVVAQYNFRELGNYGSYMRNTTGTGTWQLFTQNSVRTLFTNYGTNSLADDVAVPYQDFVPTTSTATGSYYYVNPNIAMTPRGQDAFILISAGKDRTYGTQDDIIVTP